MRNPPPLAKPRTQKHQRTFGFPRGASCCSRQRFAPPLMIVCYAWTPVCIGLMAFKRIWHVTIGLHLRLVSVSDATRGGAVFLKVARLTRPRENVINRRFVQPLAPALWGRFTGHCRGRRWTGARR